MGCTQTYIFHWFVLLLLAVHTLFLPGKGNGIYCTVQFVRTVHQSELERTKESERKSLSERV